MAKEPEIKQVMPKKVEAEPTYFEPKPGNVIVLDKERNKEFEVNERTQKMYFNDTTKYEVKKKVKK